MDQEALTITLIAENDGGPPAPIRFRRVLKRLLRECGLRCRDVKQPIAWDEARELAFAQAVDAMREAIDRGDPWSVLNDPRVVAFDELAASPAKEAS